MEQIKLEVGKTYRSRQGTDIRIIAKVLDLYKGDNGNLYTESGRLQNNMKTIHDLIEEVGSTLHTFDIPEGVKKVTVSQEGNRIVVEMVPEKEPKPGDVMINVHESVYIFKEPVGKNTHKSYAWLGKYGRLAIGKSCFSGHPATTEEAQPLWDALKKAGKRWNPETMQVEEIPEIDRIREWVEVNIKYGCYCHEDIADVIENYLKYRVDKK